MSDLNHHFVIRNFALLALAALGVAMASVALALSPGYSASQSGNLLFVRTPWGTNPYIGPVGFDSIPSYTFEISLSDYRNAVNRANGANNVGETSSVGSSQGSGSELPASALSDESTLIAEANRLYNEGEFRKSLVYVDELSQRNPKNERAWMMKGSLMHVLGHNDLAKQAWQRALELDPGNTRIQSILKETK